YATNYSTPPLLDYTIYIFNEGWSYGLATIDATNFVNFEFATKDHFVNLMGNRTTNTFTVFCNQSDVFTLRYHYNNSVTIERNYHIPTSDSPEDRIIYAYIPNQAVGVNKGDAKQVIITYVSKSLI
ncbi:unnamed protein product, partial [marine sediment metagenome]